MSAPSTEAAPGTPSSNDSPPPEAKSHTWTPASNSWLAILIFSGVILAGVLLVLAAWRLPPFATAVERTDDAYVQGLTTVISPQVSGYVSNVPVGDFAHVTRGALLLQIDPGTYAAQVEEAKAQVEAKRSEQENNQLAVAQARADLQAATASVGNAQAQLARAEGDLRRTTDLVRDGSVSARENDQNIAAVRQAQAALVEARANAQKAAEQIRTQEVNGHALAAGVDQAQAQEKATQLQLDRTRIFAPDTGQLSQVGVRPGQYVTAGTPLFYLVPGSRWVSANFKETQTRRMAAGQLAWFTVDALGRDRIRGHVSRLSPAADSQFSVLKPDNATGNFTKVPQRISVDIDIDGGQPLAARLKPGMSVEASIDTSTGPSPR